MDPLSKESKIQLATLYENIIPNIAPWSMQTPEVMLNLCRFQKSKTYSLNFQEELDEIKDNYFNCHLFMQITPNMKTKQEVHQYIRRI